MNTGFSSGILSWIVTILNKKDPADRAFGAKTIYQKAGSVHANLTWKKGQKSLNEGSLDSQDTVMFRMRWNSIITRDSLLVCDGVTYQIQSMHRDFQSNTIQITATEIIGNYEIEPEPEPEPEPTPDPEPAQEEMLA